MEKLLLSTLLILSYHFGFSQHYSITQLEKTKPFVLGEIEQIHSNILNENRTLNIYLPDNYNSSDTTQYPVIYLLDGSADEDFIHIVGLVQFNSFDWVQQVPKSIVVGIANVDRRRDFTFPSSVENDKKLCPTSGHSDKFIQFIKDELQPFIQQKFRTNQSKTLIGESFGGLLATQILFQQPSLFNKYIIISPSLWWDNGTLLDQKVLPFSNTEIYLGVGKEGLTPTTPPRVMEVDVNTLADKLKKLNYPNVKVFLDYLPNENHATISHQAVYNAFRLFYKKTNN